MLDTRIVLYERDEERRMGKLRRMKVALGFLVAAVLLMVTGSILKTVEGERYGKKDAIPVTTSSAQR